MSAKLALATAYLRTRALHAVLTDRRRIERWQRWNIERLRRHAIAHAPFYQRLGDVAFSAFPVIRKSDIMAEFDAFNGIGLGTAEAWAMLERGTAPAGHDLGCSTGTSGNRGLYLVSDRERFVWLGTIVAKAIPDVLRRRHRVSVMLPRASRLYDAANESRLFTLQFLAMDRGLEAIASALGTFRPTILVGPPKALRWLAEHGARIAPERIFSSAEVLDAPDRAIIEAAFGARLGQIYMATEGLFAVSCPHGTLHLAEDAVQFDYEAVAGDAGLVSPIVTDFTRRTQVLARYRMNDLLRLSPAPCRCGSALQAVDEVVGRRDDVFQIPPHDGGQALVTVTPDVLRNAVLAVDRGIDDFRIRQTGANAIDLVLPPRLSGTTAVAARQALIELGQRLGTAPDITVRREALPVETTAKLRRVERRWPGAEHAGEPGDGAMHDPL